MTPICYSLVEAVSRTVPLFCWGFFTMGNPGRFPQGKPAATESRYPFLINYKVPAGVFSCVRNLPDSDMDYMIFNVRT